MASGTSLRTLRPSPFFERPSRTPQRGPLLFFLTLLAVLSAGLIAGVDPVAMASRSPQATKPRLRSLRSNVVNVGNRLPPPPPHLGPRPDDLLPPSESRGSALLFLPARRWPPVPPLAAVASLVLLWVFPGPSTRWAMAAASGDPNNSQDGRLTARELVALTAASIALGAVGVALLTHRSDLAAAQAALRDAVGLTFGDVTAAALWSVALWYTNPVQVLKLFFARFDSARPSAVLMKAIDRAQSLDPTGEGYTPTPLARLATIAATGASGVTITALLGASLGESTWAVSSGLGLCILAAVFEAGRPQQMSAEEAAVDEEHWQVFRQWADLKLRRQGRCHFADVDEAFRRYPPHGRYRAQSGSGGLSDEGLHRLIARWHPSARRSSVGFYKGLSLAPAPVLAVAPIPDAVAPTKTSALLDDLLKD